MKHATLLVVAAALLEGCGGKALDDHNVSSQPGTSMDSGVGLADGGDVGLAGASGGSPPDASAAGAGGADGGDVDASLPGLSASTWKATPTPLCPGTDMASAHSVWSNGSSVYVVAASLALPEGHLFSNDGRGWVQANAAFPNSFLGITGFVKGPLIVSQQGGGCAVDFVTGGAVTCSAQLYSVDQVAVVDESLAYAVTSGGSDPRQVIRYNGSYWSATGISFDDGAPDNVINGVIWAAPGLLAVTSKSGALHLFKTSADGTRAAPLADAPAGVYTALWGSSATDVWAGNQAGGLLHRAGSSWSVAAHAQGCGGIRGIWGVGGAVYFITESAFGQWSNGVATTPYQIPCGDLKLVAIWGNSASEIFITLTNPDLAAAACGSSRAIWYNGSEFAPL